MLEQSPPPIPARASRCGRLPPRRSTAPSRCTAHGPRRHGHGRPRRPGRRLAIASMLAPQGPRDPRARPPRAERSGRDGRRSANAARSTSPAPRVEKADIARGDWIVAPALVSSTSRADVRLRLLPSETRAAPPLDACARPHRLGRHFRARIALLEGSRRWSRASAALGQTRPRPADLRALPATGSCCATSRRSARSAVVA